MCPPSLRIKFKAKIRNVQGCLRAWSRGDQTLGHPCNHFTLYTIYIHIQHIPPPPISGKGKKYPIRSKVKKIDPVYLKHQIPLKLRGGDIRKNNL